MPDKRKNGVERGAFIKDDGKGKKSRKAASPKPEDKPRDNAKGSVSAAKASDGKGASKRAAKPDSKADGKVTHDSPIIKVEFSSGTKRVIVVGALIAIAVVAALYVAGLMFYNSALTNASFVFAVVAAVVLFLGYRKIGRNGTNLTPEQIDAKVDAYKADLIETFVGYDVPYTKQDILDAADKYRARLENGNRANSDADVNSVASVASAMIKDAGAARGIRKEQKAQRKKFKKDSKKDKKLFSK